MDLGISSRVALVTGAGRGIGAEICTTLAAEGVHIAVNDLFQERADETLPRSSARMADRRSASPPMSPITMLSAPRSRATVAEFGAVDI